MNIRNKALPFPSKFIDKTVTDPLQVYQAFDYAETKPEIHTIVIDTLTYLMDMFENQYVLKASNTMKGWSEYAQFFQNLMQDKVAKSTKNVIFLAHTMDVLNESEMVSETLVKVKGSLMNKGVESAFTTVISTKKMPISKLEGFSNDYLNITPEEESIGIKYVFQTGITKETVNERMRSPLKMWSQQETYIDNDLQHVIDRLHKYYS